jgi:hypothetical protein
MKVKLIEVSTQREVDALIREGKLKEMPSLQDNWRFNFNKQIGKPNCTAYVLVTEERPDVIEGCLIFEMIKKQIPSIAYVEIAPHNKYNERIYDKVAGCLIAYAFKQSLIKGKDDYKGLLFLDVGEDNEKDQRKLMSVYSKKYNAKATGETTMVIMDEDGEKLIKQYLES